MFTYMVSDGNGLAQSTAMFTYMVSDGNELAQSTAMFTCMVSDGNGLAQSTATLNLHIWSVMVMDWLSQHQYLHVGSHGN